MGESPILICEGGVGGMSYLKHVRTEPKGSEEKAEVGVRARRKEPKRGGKVGKGGIAKTMSEKE